MLCLAICLGTIPTQPGHCRELIEAGSAPSGSRLCGTRPTTIPQANRIQRPRGFINVRPYLHSLHVKDLQVLDGLKLNFEYCPLGEGDVDYPTVLRNLRDHRCDVVFAVATHFKPPSGSGADAMRINFAKIRPLIEQVEGPVDKEDMMSKQLNVAIIGCGGISGAHIPNILTTPEICLVATMDVVEEAVSRGEADGLGRVSVLKRGTRTTTQPTLTAYSLIPTLMRCSSALPTIPMRISLSKRGAAGKHIFAEKPLAMTLE